MNWQNSVATLVTWATSSLEYAVNFSLQSSLLIVAGLALGALFRKRGSANQSLVYRTTLGSVLLCPLVTWGLSMAGFSGWSVAVPEGYRFAEIETVSTESQLAEPTTGEKLANETSSGEVGHHTHSAKDSALANLPAFAEQAPATGSTQRTHQPNSKTTQEASEPATEAVPIAFTLTWVGVLALCFAFAWCIVSLWLLARLATAWHRLKRLWRHASPAERVIQVRCRKLATLLRVPAPAVLCTPLLLSPCLAGLRRPAILLPESEVNLTIDGVLVHEVLIHELAHLSRRDHHWNLLRQLATAVFFYQPLLWYLSRRIEATAEEVCDDFVVQHGADRSEYAHRLLDLAEQGTAPIVTVGVGIVSLRSMLARRVLRITDTSRKLSTRVSNLLLVLVLVGGFAGTAVVGLVGLGPQETLAEGEANAAEAREGAVPTESEATAGEESTSHKFAGTVVDPDGNPVEGAQVAVIGTRNITRRGGDFTSADEVLAEGRTDDDGRFHFSIEGASSKSHLGAHLIARHEGLATNWQKLNLDAPATQVTLALEPEVPIRSQLVDREGHPAAGVPLVVRSVMKRLELRTEDGVAYYGHEIPAAWIPLATSDDEGRFAIHGVPADHGVLINVTETERFAPQRILLNSGMPEERGERDGTYRSLVKNLEPGEEAVLSLTPPQIFEGTVTYEDTGEPAPHARLNIWASEQEPYGSMVSVAGQADAQGRYRISSKPGIRFGITAYPPDGTPYLPRITPRGDSAIRWQEGDTSRLVNLALPRAVLVRGKVVEARSGTPVPEATIQYVPELDNNPLSVGNLLDGWLTGWEASVRSKETGEFKIAVLPGPGRLLVHGPQGKYVLQEIGWQRLQSSKPGGQRNYAHGIYELNLAEGEELLEATIALTPGATATGRIVDEQGQLADEVLVISRMEISPIRMSWMGGHTFLPTLGGRFELGGLAKSEGYPIYFLDAKRRLGATEVISADDSDLTIVLQPCGSVSVKAIDSAGEPVEGWQVLLEMVVTPGPHRNDFEAVRRGELLADLALVQNIDRKNHPPKLESNSEGHITFNALIPGATYWISTYIDGKWKTMKEFSVEPGEHLDLGEIKMKWPL